MTSNWLSRGFWIVMYAITGAIFLSWFLKDATPAIVIIPAALTGWFGGKAVAAYQNKAGGA